MGDIFNDLIRINSKGNWSLKIKDTFSDQDDGTLNSWTLKIEPALDSIVKIPLAGDITEYIDNLPKDDTDYFYRIRAKTDVGDGEFSTTQNARTFKTIFGHGTDDLVVLANETFEITSDKEYKNITVNDGAILYVSNAILKCEKYQEINSGHIEVKTTGCAGGIAGKTHGGGGGFAYRKAIGRGKARPATNGTPGIITPPGIASACTDLTAVSIFIDETKQVDIFESKFKNQVKGGKGSDGTVAAPSGSGGRGGIDGFRRRWTNHIGGRGGVGAQGVAGVIGGGKAAIFFSEIVSKITILAKGKDGNNGNKGTAAPGSIASPVWGGASNGNPASANGTLGSKGSQGGIVFLMAL